MRRVLNMVTAVLTGTAGGAWIAHFGWSAWSNDTFGIAPVVVVTAVTAVGLGTVGLPGRIRALIAAGALAGAAVLTAAGVAPSAPATVALLGAGACMAAV